jgi:hypothetical protein
MGTDVYTNCRDNHQPVPIISRDLISCASTPYMMQAHVAHTWQYRGGICTECPEGDVPLHISHFVPNADRAPPASCTPHPFRHATPFLSPDLPTAFHTTALHVPTQAVPAASASLFSRASEISFPSSRRAWMYASAGPPHSSYRLAACRRGAGVTPELDQRCGAGGLKLDEQQQDAEDKDEGQLSWPPVGLKGPYGPLRLEALDLLYTC